MQEMGIDFSREGLFKFLDFTAEKGLMNRGTVGTRKKACANILDILDANEAADLSKIDLEDVIRRHSILTIGKFVPATLKGYQGHLRGSIKDFLEYAKNPSSWRPAAQKRTTQATKVTTPAKKPKESNLLSKLKEPKNEEEKNAQPTLHIDFQIHISPETTPEQIDQIFASMRRHLYGS